VSISGGFAAVGLESTFSFNETSTIIGLPGSQTSSGSGESSGFIYGGYVGGKAAYYLSDKVSWFVGGKWQGVGSYTHTVKGRTAEVDFANAYFLTGVSFDF